MTDNQQKIFRRIWWYVSDRLSISVSASGSGTDVKLTLVNEYIRGGLSYSHTMICPVFWIERILTQEDMKKMAFRRGWRDEDRGIFRDIYLPDTHNWMKEGF